MYEIENLETFSDSIRREVVSTYGLDDRHVTTGQIMGYVAGRFEADGGFVLEDGDLEEIVKFAVSTALGSCMSEMAANGELECAWDEEKNDMIWWLPEGSD